MKNMINLNDYADRAVEFMIGDKVIRCPELSYKDMRKINEYEANKETTPDDEEKIVLFLLNRNTSGVKFTNKELDKLPAGAISRIYVECVTLSRKPLTEKN